MSHCKISFISAQQVVGRPVPFFVVLVLDFHTMALKCDIQNDYYVRKGSILNFLNEVTKMGHMLINSVNYLVIFRWIYHCYQVSATSDQSSYTKQLHSNNILNNSIPFNHNTHQYSRKMEGKQDNKEELIFIHQLQYSSYCKVHYKAHNKATEIQNIIDTESWLLSG